MSEKKERERGEAREQILKVLEDEEKPLRSGEISDKIEEEYWSISGRVLHYNLNKLIEEGKVKKSNGKYQLSSSYREHLLDETVTSIAEKSEITGHAEHPFGPIFSFGQTVENVGEEISYAGNFDPEKIDNALQEKFTSIIHVLLSPQVVGVGGDEPKEYKEILEFSTRCVQVGLEETGGYIGDFWFEDMDDPRTDLLTEIRDIHLEKVEEVEGEVTQIEKVILSEILGNENWDETLASCLLEGVEEALENSRVHGQGSGKNVTGTTLKNNFLPPHHARMLALALINHLYSGISSTSVRFGAQVRDLLNAGKLKFFGFNDPQGREFKQKFSEDFFESVRPLVEERTKEAIKGNRYMPASIGNGIEREIITSIPNDREKNLKWLREHAGAFIEFLEDVENIHFGILGGVGYEELENYPEKFELPRAIDRFLESLERPIDWNYRKEELEAIIEECESVIRRLRHDREPREIEDPFVEAAFKWGFRTASHSVEKRTPKYLYENYPEAKNISFWKKVRDKAKEALEREPPQREESEN